jgi:uroporphyrinogen-III decarboxylase
MRFERPSWIPSTVGLLPAAWAKHGEAAEAIILAHPKLFPHYKQGQFKNMTMPRSYRKGRWTDAWGIVWDNLVEGMAAIPVEELAPLRDWATFDTYRPPDPMKVTDEGDPVDWEARAKSIANSKQHDGLPSGGFIHGFMYMRLFYLRGFTNFMMDVGAREPRLDRLIAVVRDFNVKIVEKYLDAGIEMMSGGDDLGMQAALPISPADWRRYLTPCYEAIFGPCRDKGVYVYLHTDGHILEIIPELIKCGVTVVNPQIRANGLPGLVKYAKGKICICLDLDRQLFPFATPAEIKAHIREARDTLYLPEGGLMLTAECAPDVPLANIAAICEGIEEVGGGPR